MVKKEMNLIWQYKTKHDNNKTKGLTPKNWYKFCIVMLTFFLTIYGFGPWC